ncbi:MAG: hypothetical protein KIT80_04200 [Chitinophagaceae bacterium]|nr:hypothetical protein [Chitinophagaceae bacterium]MCW5926091.1 hypothetical protein [Chitinophagaceae bacterium]
MKIHSTNYFNTFIQVADDCPAIQGEAPPQKNNKTVAGIQFNLVTGKPYQYTSDDVLFLVYADKNDLTPKEYKTEREKFYSKGQPCMRASPLTKRYGWGIHYDKDGKIAIYGRETKEYQQFSADKKLKVIKAMKSAR